MIELVGRPELLPEGVAMLRKGGTFVEIGLYFPGHTVTFDASTLVLTGKHIVGSVAYTPDIIPKLLDFLSRSQDTVPFKKMVSHRFKLDEVNQAFEQARVGRPPDRRHPRRPRPLGGESRGARLRPLRAGDPCVTLAGAVGLISYASAACNGYRTPATEHMFVVVIVRPVQGRVKQALAGASPPRPSESGLRRADVPSLKGLPHERGDGLGLPSQKDGGQRDSGRVATRPVRGCEDGHLISGVPLREGRRGKDVPAPPMFDPSAKMEGCAQTHR